MSAEIKKEVDSVCSYAVAVSASILSYDVSELLDSDAGKTDRRRITAGSRFESAPCAVCEPISSWSKRAMSRIVEFLSRLEEEDRLLIKPSTLQYDIIRLSSRGEKISS